MKWFKGQWMVLLTLILVGGSGLVSWGRLTELCTQIEQKADRATVAADKEALIRELNTIQQQLAAINNRLDGVIIHREIIER